MEIEKADGAAEREILTAMIVDKIVLGKVVSKWDPRIFESLWANLVGGWCVEYFEKYKKAPKAHIEGLFEVWAEGGVDNDTVLLVDKFLGGLSDDYETVRREINSDYMIDKAGRYFSKVRLRRFAQQLQGDLDLGRLKKVKDRIINYAPFQMGGDEGVNVLEDKNAVREVFSAVEKDLVVYNEALKHFFKSTLTRDALVAVMGPEKRGKTFWLMDIAWRAVVQRRRVAMFQVGDMSQNQMIRRFAVRAAGKPLNRKSSNIPISITHEPGEDFCQVTHKRKEFKEGLSEEDVYQGFERRVKSSGGDGTLLKLSTHPNSTLSVKGIEAILQGWERGGWIPDVIVIDYADILDMGPTRGDDNRSPINSTWEQLRAMSQRRHCLVVTATQADAASYSQRVMNMGNFSEDKRKYAHVTGMFGLNQTPGEKELGIYRLNWIALRERDYDLNKLVYVAGCLGVGRPAMISCF